MVALCTTSFNLQKFYNLHKAEFNYKQDKVGFFFYRVHPAVFIRPLKPIYHKSVKHNYIYFYLSVTTCCSLHRKT